MHKAHRAPRRISWIGRSLLSTLDATDTMRCPYPHEHATNAGAARSVAMRKTLAPTVASPISHVSSGSNPENVVENLEPPST